MTLNNPPTTIASRRSNLPGWLDKVSLRTKLIAGFLLIAAFTAAVVGYSINRTFQTELTNSISENLNSQARVLALTTGNGLEKQIELLKTLELDPTLGKAIEAANLSYEGDPAAIQARINQLDQQWRAADRANNNDDPLVKAAISNESAQNLKLFRLLYADHIEVFITDQYGALVATTNRTTDYYQADEDWWQAGKTAVYFSTPVYDESSHTYSCEIALPFRDQNAKVIGVLRSTYRISALLQNLAAGRLGETSFANLLFPTNELVNAAGYQFTIDPETRTKLMTTSEGIGRFDYNGKERLVTQTALTSTSTEKTAIRNLNWILVVDQDPREIDIPVAAAAQTAFYIGLGTLLVASLLGVLAAQFLVAPITQLTLVAQQVRAGNLDARAKINTEDEIGVLADSLNAMTAKVQETLQELEQRVAERTMELEQRSKELADRTVSLELANVRMQIRAAQFQAISDVSRATASVRKLNELLPRIAKVVSEQFGFYHTGIFLLDEAGVYAILSAASSEGGHRMLGRGHRLKVGSQGIVGYVTNVGEPRIALDTGADAVFFDNPDLPETRSELAIPLKSGGKIIGALDVQSNQSNAFTKEDSEVLQILADQVSAAIDNARQFEQTQRSLSEVETIYRQYLRHEWERISDSESMLGYRHTVAGTELLERPYESSQTSEALASGTIQADINPENNESTLAVPIKLRDEIIGMLNIRAPQKRAWSNDEINMVKSVADRVAISAENARLFEETTNRAERERTVSEITSKIRSTNDPNEMVQIALNELKQALNVKSARIVPYVPPRSQDES